MKKTSLIPCIVAAVVLCGCVCFYMIRNLGGGLIRISDLQHSAVSSPSESTDGVLLTMPVNINTADLEQLMTLPGIGAVYAQGIIDYREEHGPFSDISELLNVPGIGQKRLDAISDYITTGG